MGRVRCAPLPLFVLVGGTSGWLSLGSPGGRGEGLRRSHDDAAGTELGSSPVERTAVNVGTVPVLTLGRVHQHGSWGWVRSSADRVGAGRSRRSTPSRGKPGTWGRAAAGSRREGCCYAERSTGEYRWPGPGRAGPEAGIGDAGQASPLGGGRFWSPVR